MDYVTKITESRLSVSACVPLPMEPTFCHSSHLRGKTKSPSVKVLLCVYGLINRAASTKQ